MRRFVGSSTSALLHEASAQLTGGAKSTPTAAAVVDDDGLAVSSRYSCC